VARRSRRSRSLAWSATAIPFDSDDEIRRHSEPSDDEGNPFGAQHIRGCFAPLSNRPAVAWGWDLGRKQDWTVGIGLDADGHVCEALRFQKPWNEQIKIIKAFVKNTPALVDETGVGDPVVEAIKEPTRRSGAFGSSG
jgi:hypothetical protein